MWRRAAALRAAATQRLSLLHTISALEQTTVSAAVAELVSLRSAGLTQLPADVQAAIDAAAADANRKSVYSKGRQLADKLKTMSRSKHRGGVHPNMREAAAAAADGGAQRALRGKRCQAKHFTLGGLVQQSAVAVEGNRPPADYWEGKAVAAVDSADDPERFHERGGGDSGGGLYDESAALAYAATRVPGCYAALHRVLLELRQVAPPGWRPATMLDFGAGPGTATWAAQQVWPDGAPMGVSAVEPSGGMSWLGHAIQQQRQAQYQQYLDARGGRAASAAVVPLGSTAASDEEGQQPNMHEADSEGGGGAGEPPPVPAAVRWSSRLPPRYRGPGKRHDLVVAAYVLGELRSDGERRRVVADLWRRTGRFLVLVEPGTPVGSLRIRRARAQVLAAAEEAAAAEGGGATSAAALHAAHVAAPCPHDGACPLEGRASWCHFGQRFLRSELQRRAQASAGRPPPRSHQDERFSYVVLSRGPRAPALPQVHVAGALPPPADELADAAEYLAVPDGLRPKRVAPLLGGRGSGRAGRRALPGARSGSDSDSENNSGSDSDSENNSGSDSDAEVLIGGQDECDGFEEDDSSDEVEEAMRRLILESLDEGAEDDGDAEDVRLRLAELEAELAAAMEEERQQTASRRAASQGARGAEGEHCADEAEVEYGEGGEAAEAAARAASAGWSRLLRPPRKRGGHVLVDLCSAADAEGRHLGGGEGRVLRQVVSRGAAARATGGVAPFKLARRLRWGDMWPMSYQRALPGLEPPATAAAGGRGESD